MPKYFQGLTAYAAVNSTASGQQSTNPSSNQGLVRSNTAPPSYAHPDTPHDPRAVVGGGARPPIVGGGGGGGGNSSSFSDQSCSTGRQHQGPFAFCMSDGEYAGFIAGGAIAGAALGAVALCTCVRGAQRRGICLSCGRPRRQPRSPSRGPGRPGQPGPSAPSGGRSGAPPSYGEQGYNLQNMPPAQSSSQQQPPAYQGRGRTSAAPAGGSGARSRSSPSPHRPADQGSNPYSNYYQRR